MAGVYDGSTSLTIRRLGVTSRLHVRADFIEAGVRQEPARWHADTGGSTVAERCAPSTELRQWYDHEEERFDEFAIRYRAELATNPAVDRLLNHTGPIVLLTATSDVDISHAAVLRAYLLETL